MDKTVNKELYQFIEAINIDADEECESIKRKAREDKRKKLLESLERFEQISLSQSQEQEKKFQKENNKRITQLENDIKKQLSNKRSSIEAEVFQKVTEKLKGFTKSQQYKQFLLDSAKEIGLKVKGNNLVIFMREEDMFLSEEIKSAISRQCNVQSTKDIVIGGLKACTDIRTADDTLEKRLESEHEWFMKNSMMSIV